MADINELNLRPRVCVLSDDGNAGTALAQRIEGWPLWLDVDSATGVEELAASTYDVLVVAAPCTEATLRHAQQAAARPPHPYVLVLSALASARAPARRRGPGRASIKHVAPEALQASLFELVACAIPLRRLAGQVTGQLSLKDVQRHARTAMLLEAFARADGSRRLAARILGVTRPAVQQMLAALDLAETEEG